MSGFNLPPGVSVNDIPGNRPEDIAWDRLWERLDGVDPLDLAVAMKKDGDLWDWLYDRMIEKYESAEAAEKALAHLMKE